MNPRELDAARELARQYTNDPIVERDIAEMFSELFELKIARQRLEDKRNALIDRTADACRRAWAMQIGPVAIGNAVGVTRQQVDNYVTGRTRPDHKKLDEIGAPK